MRIREVTVEIGTTGRSRRMILGDYRADVATAVEAEHPCEESQCDICAALKAGCPLSAAHLLSGATETPFLDAVLGAHRLNRTAEPYGVDCMPADWAEWVEYHKTHGRRCLHCESFNYSEPDDSDAFEGYCGNCGKQSDKQTDDPDAEEAS